MAAHIFASRQSDFGRLAADLRDNVSGQRRSELMGRCAPPWEQISVAVQRAITSGEVRKVDADLVARLFFAMVGSQMWWSNIGTHYPEPDDRLAATIADLVLDGIEHARAKLKHRDASGLNGDPPVVRSKPQSVPALRCKPPRARREFSIQDVWPTASPPQSHLLL